MTATTTRTAQDTIAKTLTTGVMLTALVVSFLHIVITFDHLGAGWDKWIAPLMIDTIAIIGKIYTSARYTAPTRRAGRSAFYAAGTLSLICNVLAGWFGNHYGSMIIGVITVTAALWGESMIGKGQVKASATRAPGTSGTTKTPTAPAAKVKDPAKVAAAKKGAATRAARKAAALTVAETIPTQRATADETIPATRYV